MSKYTSISGTIINFREHVSSQSTQSDYNLNKAKYSYITLEDDTGELRALKGVQVINVVDGFLKPGVKATLHYFKLSKNNSFVFALEAEGRKVFDLDEVRKVPARLRLIGYCWLLAFPLPVIYMFFRQPIIAAVFAAIWLYGSYGLLISGPRPYSLSKIQAYLTEQGFKV